jgi:hypothetical protein
MADTDFSPPLSKNLFGESVCEGKVCRVCRRMKPFGDFPWRVRRGRRERGYDCNACRHKANLVRGRSPAGRGRKREHNLLRKYKLTEADYVQILEGQGGVCAICCGNLNARDGRREGHRKFCVDHDHRTGLVRGILCGLCNRGLGCFRDDPALLQTAFAYLARSREPEQV